MTYWLILNELFLELFRHLPELFDIIPTKNKNSPPEQTKIV